MKNFGFILLPDKVHNIAEWRMCHNIVEPGLGNLLVESKGALASFMIASEQHKSRAVQVATDATLDLRCSFTKPGRYKRVPILRLPFNVDSRSFSTML
jgi:hypothetical protein